MFVAVCAAFFAVSFSFTAFAQNDVWMSAAWDAIDSDTAELLEDIGMTAADGGDFAAALTPERLLDTVLGLFGTSLSDMLKKCFPVIVILFITALFSSVSKGSKTAEAAENTCMLAAVFVIIGLNADVFTGCRAAIELTEDMMLSLIPVLTGIAAFSGNPACAASFNTVVFAFAQTVSAAFVNILPAVSAVGTALGAASAAAPLGHYGGLCKIIAKAVNTAAAFVSGIFVAVLSVRGVIAGAADTVTIKGLRFLIGSSVPVVGSAVGDALNSVSAGLGLVKNSLFSLGIAAVALISLPPLLRLAVWSLLLNIISGFAGILSLGRITELISAVKSVISVLAAVTFFNAFVYIISCAILITIKNS